MMKVVRDEEPEGSQFKEAFEDEASKVVPPEPEMTAKYIRSLKTHEECGKKVNSLVLNYLRDAHQDSLGEDFYFKKYNNEWKNFVKIKNKQQRDVVLYSNAFELRVEHMLELAKTQLKDLKAQPNEEIETKEHRGEETEG
jgi:hypothetical protein